jgi:hypothetical protein
LSNPAKLTTPYDEIERYFADPGKAKLDRHETLDSEHGRIELRRQAVSHAVDFLNGERRFQASRGFRG